jgi:hypothetical protein
MDELYISYSKQSGVLINSNAGPNKFVEEMLFKWMQSGAKQIRISIDGKEATLTRKIDRRKKDEKNL